MKKIIYYTFALVLVLLCFSEAPEIHNNNFNYLSQLQYIRSNNKIFKLFTLTFLFLLCIIHINKNIFNIKFGFFIKSILIFKIYILFKFIFYNSFHGLYELILFSVLSFIFTIIFYIFSRKQIFEIVQIAAVIFLLVNIVQIISNFSIMFISGRFVSITGNSNHAAIAIVLFTPPFLLNINNNSKKLLNFLILLLLVSLLFLTGSRTGLLTFSFFLFFFYPNKNKFILFSFSIVFAYFLVTKLFLNKVDFDYASVFDRVQTNSTNRNQNWTEAFINFSENPFFGRSMEDSDTDRNIVENSFLACLSNYGFVGSVFFINAFVYLLKIGIKSIRSIDIYTSISASIIIAIIIGGLFEGYLLSNLSLPTVSILLYSNFINHKLQFT